MRPTCCNKPLTTAPRPFRAAQADCLMAALPSWLQDYVPGFLRPSAKPPALLSAFSSCPRHSLDASLLPPAAQVALRTPALWQRGMHEVGSILIVTCTTYCVWSDLRMMVGRQEHSIGA